MRGRAVSRGRRSRSRSLSASSTPSHYSTHSCTFANASVSAVEALPRLQTPEQVLRTPMVLTPYLPSGVGFDASLSCEWAAPLYKPQAMESVSFDQAHCMFVVPAATVAWPDGNLASDCPPSANAHGTNGRDGTIGGLSWLGSRESMVATSWLQTSVSGRSMCWIQRRMRSSEL